MHASPGTFETLPAPSAIVNVEVQVSELLTSTHSLLRLARVDSCLRPLGCSALTGEEDGDMDKLRAKRDGIPSSADIAPPRF